MTERLTGSLQDLYRPTVLDDFMGNEQVIASVKNALKPGKRLPQLIIFSGPPGVGKTSLARALARAVNCEKKQKPDCDCPSCSILGKYNHGYQNYHDFKEMDCADSRGIQDARDLKNLARKNPLHSMRIIYMDEVHQLTGPCKEAMLKEVESPPKKTLWIFTTTDPQKIPDKIIDRGVHYHLKRPRVDDLVKKLQWVAKEEGYKLKAKAATELAVWSDCNARNALANLSKLLNDATKTTIKDCKELFRDQEDQWKALVGLLKAMYHDDRLMALKHLALIEDFSWAVRQLPFLNGFAMYEIGKTADKNITNPFFGTKSCWDLWNGIKKDMQNDKVRRKVFNRTFIIAERLVELGRIAMGPVVGDEKTTYIGVLLRG